MSNVVKYGYKVAQTECRKRGVQKSPLSFMLFALRGPYAP